MNKSEFPSEIIDLPSQGKLYPKESPLSSGTIELRYPTAKSEDILTNQSYIEKGVVIDKFLQSLIVDPSINYNDLLIGDKNAILVAARVLGYGGTYSFPYRGKIEEVDLSKLQTKELSEEVQNATENSFSYTLPASKVVVTFRLLTHGDEQKVEQELRGLKKLGKDNSAELSTRLKYVITSVNGNEDIKEIRAFVDNMLLARDARALRQHIAKIQPDIDMTFVPEDSDTPVMIPILPSFLWPDLEGVAE
jgi:hypothetical protein